MSAIITENKAITIEYLPSEQELDLRIPLLVGSGLSTSKINITELLGSKDYFSVSRYLTNLDPVVVDYDETLTPEEKEKKKERINKDIERLERVFGKGNLDATNKPFWSKVELKLLKKTTNLDLNNPKNELIVNCIKAGGFTTVATSFENALDTGKKFYLIEPIEFVENRVSPRRIVNNAAGELEKLDTSKGFDDLFFVAKYLLPVEKSYTKNTPKSEIYEDLDKYLKGELIKDSKIKLASRFLEVVKKPKKELISYCYIKDALVFDIINQTPAGEYKNNETGGIYGTTIEKAAEHISSSAYSHELENVRERVEKKWNK